MAENLKSRKEKRFKLEIFASAFLLATSSVTFGNMIGTVVGEFVGEKFNYKGIEKPIYVQVQDTDIELHNPKVVTCKMPVYTNYNIRMLNATENFPEYLQTSFLTGYEDKRVIIYDLEYENKKALAKDLKK